LRTKDKRSLGQEENGRFTWGRWKEDSCVLVGRRTDIVFLEGWRLFLGCGGLRKGSSCKVKVEEKDDLDI